VIRRLEECFNRLGKTKPCAGIASRARSRLLRGRQGVCEHINSAPPPLENFEILAVSLAFVGSLSLFTSVLLRPLL
jgi:hypothetical protein